MSASPANIYQLASEVLDQGLPAEQREPPASAAPLAFWRGERYGAVALAHAPGREVTSTEPTGDGRWIVYGVMPLPSPQPQDLFIEHLLFDRDEDQHWRLRGGGGHGPVPPLLLESRPDGSAEPIQWIGGIELAGEAAALVGIASASVAAVVTATRAGTRRQSIDSPYGVFVLGFEPPGQATLTAVDRRGQPIVRPDGRLEVRNLREDASGEFLNEIWHGEGG
jgi:hypothetical protein